MKKLQKFGNVAFLLLVFAIGSMYAQDCFAQKQSKDSEYPKIIKHDDWIYSLQLEDGSFVKLFNEDSIFLRMEEKKGIIYVYSNEVIFIRGDLATLNIPQTDNPTSVCKFILRKEIYNPTAKEVAKNMTPYWKLLYWEPLGFSEKEVCTMVKKIWKKGKKNPKNILRKVGWATVILFYPEWANTPQLETCLRDIVTEVLSHRKYDQFIETILLPRKDFYCKIMPAEEFDCH